MDDIDKKIVKFLQEDGRMNYSDIATKLNLANATIHARVIKLKKRGIISKFMVVINPESIEKNISFMFSITVDHKNDVVDDTIKKIVDMKDVVNVWCVTGDWDYTILFCTKNVNSMKSIITKKIKKYVPHIIRSSAQMILEKSEKPISLP